MGRETEDGEREWWRRREEGEKRHEIKIGREEGRWRRWCCSGVKRSGLQVRYALGSDWKLPFTNCLTLEKFQYKKWKAY